MLSEMQTIISFITQYGVSGISLVFFCCILYLIRKLATNHLYHIDLKIDKAIQGIEDLSTDIKDMKKNCTTHGEKIAKLEGISGV